MAKVNTYSQYEIEFLEDKLQELEQYIKDNPFHTLDDRMGWRPGKNGDEIPYCIATKEAQRKDITQAIKDYAEILQQVERIREKEEVKSTLRGGKEASGRAKRLLGGD